MKPTFDLGKGLYVISAVLILIATFLIFLKSPLFFRVAGFHQTDSAVKEYELDKQQTVDTLLLHDSQGDIEIALYIEGRLKEMAVGYRLEDYQSLSSLEEISTVILATEDWTGLDTTRLIEFVETGGNLVIAGRPAPQSTFQRIYQQLGIIEYGGFIEAEDVTVFPPFFSLDEKLELSGDDFRQSLLSARLHSDALVVAETGLGQPVLWTYALGEGKVYFFNGVLSKDSYYAPLLTWAFAKTAAPIYPIVYAGAALLDGFPFPTQTTRLVDGKSEKNYYRQDWWLQMQSLEAKFDLNYTAAAIYPADLGEVNSYDQELELYTRELVLLGGELGAREYEDLSVELPRLKQAVGNYPIISVLDEEEIRTPLPVSPTNQTLWESLSEAFLYGTQVTSFSPYAIYGDERDVQMWRDVTDFLDSIQETYDVPYVPYSEMSKRKQQWEQNDYVIDKQGNELNVTLRYFTDHTYFHFVTADKITATSNCEITKIGEQFYLVRALGPQFSIETE
ncbi:hypothetical protein CQS04_06270 [Chryseomicrobium excrementi]|uniref:DUF2194 domain-containing protein n=1 Tax=Chryseomicrobium excrementi TaxID=2041346 RepID=A0A2M9EZX6_9BACL|nr:DUF2194 domain-containing protein [Chryseomicrobium excrementi]PJK16755.1 hypothetical protein CQS04_06270 [Chryseomicrobium excrementi]